MPYDIDYREEDCVTNDISYALVNKGPDVVGAFFVPGEAKRITRVRIHASNDVVADAPAGWSTAVELSGMGLLEKDKNYQFTGPFGQVTSDTAAFCAAAIMGDAVTYNTNIPVVGGNEILARGGYWGVLANGVRIGVWLEFDGIPGPIVDVDYREQDLTAVNTPVLLRNRLGVLIGPFKTTGKRIIEVRCGGGLTTDHGDQACLTNYRMMGPALQGRNYEHGGPSYAGQVDTNQATAGGHGIQEIPEIWNTLIEVDDGAVFDAEGVMIEDDMGTIYGTLTVCYG